MTAAPAPYPVAVAEWVGDQPGRQVLDLASGRGGFAVQLAAQGHHVTCVDRRPHVLTELAARLFREGSVLTDHTAVPAERIATVAGQAENLPFADTSFDLVTVAEQLHRFAPGLALAEAARVLRPGGSLVAIYHTRDDTVPWVKRLARLVQQYDASIMSGDHDQGSIASLTESPYFAEPVRKTFRNWIPINRPAMLAMIERHPAVAALGEAPRDELLAGVGEVYDSSARAPEPLLLPFQASVWRAEVDHSEVRFTDGTDDGLDIALRL